MTATTAHPRIFTLAEAEQLLGAVRAVTEEAVGEAEQISEDLDRLSSQDPARSERLQAFETVVQDWTARMEALGIVVKGLWLVDFDNGEGYYCWKYPEPAIRHYHGYDEGFAGRMKIV